MVIRAFGREQHTYGAAFFIALSFFFPLVNIFGWTMILHVAPFYFFAIVYIVMKSGLCMCTPYKNACIMLFLLALYTVFSWLCIDNFPGTAGKVLRHLYEAVVFFFITGYPFTDKAKHFLVNAYIFATCFVAIRLVFFSYSLGEADRQSLSNFGHTMDPNYLAALFIFPFLVCFYRCLRERYNVKYWLILFTLSGGVFAMGSRGTYLSLVVGMMVIFMTTQRNIGNFIKGLLVFFILLLVAIPFLSPEQLARMNPDNAADGSNTLRLALWFTCWDIFMSSPILGRGGDAMIALGMQYGAPLNLIAHNTYLTLLADYGLIGITLFMVPFFMIVSKTVEKRYFVLVAILISTMICGVFISAEHSAFWWQNLIMAAILLRSDNLQKVLLR